MNLANSEILDNCGDLLKILGKAMQEASDGGKKITIKEWVGIGQGFLGDMMEDLLDDDDV